MNKGLKRSNRFLDTIFAIGIVLTTMTSIRFGNLPIGIGELLLLSWIIYNWLNVLKKQSIKINDKTIVYFWIFYFFSLSLGIFFSVLHSRFDLQTALYDFLAYLFIFVLCLTLSFDISSLKRKIELTVTIGVLLYTFLALWFNFIGNNFYGLRLGEYRFTGGAKNPNQLSLFLTTIPFISAYLLFKQNNEKNRFLKRTMFLLIIILSIYVGNLTHSQALTGAWLISLLLLIVLLLFKLIKFPHNVVVLVTTLCIIGINVIINNDIINNLTLSVYDWFNELDEDGSRAFLWGLGLQTALSSPLFGYGPGPQLIHSFTHRSEVHNTFLDIFTQAGFLGLLIFLGLIGKVFTRVKSNLFLSTAIFSLIIFSFSHFIFRQPVFWLFVIFFLSIQYENNRRSDDAKS